MRPAMAEDLEAIGSVQATTMLASLQVAHAQAHQGVPLPQADAARVSALMLADGWRQAVAQPPSPAHRVLVATLGEQVVGLAALAPTTSAPPDQHDPGPTRALEVVSLGVLPDFQRQGHGSRLLAATVDHAREHGAQALVVWALRGEESLTRFLESLGLRPTGAHRDLPVGQGLAEDCWAASLQQP